MNLPAIGPVRLVPEAPELATLYERELPQKDQLCGAFWGSLALAAAGYPVDQNEVALRAGTTLAEGDPLNPRSRIAPDRRPSSPRPILSRATA